MAESICILSCEAEFSQMLRLELEDAGYTVSVTQRKKRLPRADVYLIDRDTFSITPPAHRVLAYGRGKPSEGVYLSRPFALPDLLSALHTPKREQGLVMVAEERAVYLNGTRIPLSVKEYALLACLLRANGAPVSRKHLLCEVWGEGQREGVVTVYLHYLRKKLERGGKKILYAVRGGYALRLEDTV